MLAERLKFETEVLKLLVLLSVAIGGGSLGLLLGESSYMKIILAGIGVPATLFIIGVIWLQYVRIRSIIDSNEGADA